MENRQKFRERGLNKSPYHFFAGLFIYLFFFAKIKITILDLKYTNEEVI